MLNFNEATTIRFKGKVEDIPAHICMVGIAGFQILPHLGDNAVNTILINFIHSDGTSRVCFVDGIEDALAFNLTINDFKNFAQFVEYIGRWFPKTFNKSTKLSLSLMYSDYLYFKKLKED
jgi:hypothetical protein